MDTAVTQVQGVGCRKQDDTEIQVSLVCGCDGTLHTDFTFCLLIFVTFYLFFIKLILVPFDLQESNRVY